MSDGQKALKLLTEDFASLLQEIIKQVEDLSGEISTLEEDFIGFDYDSEDQEKDIPEAQESLRTLRIYWYRHSVVPRVVYAFLQFATVAHLMGEATPGAMSHWYPEARDLESQQKLIAEAFDRGHLQLEDFEFFIAEIREMLPTIRESVIRELKRVGSGS